ncbi:MAG: OsmC family protein [Acidobacteriia bacterium]|nr:OsmC family protein [Terriglobia bacterium]
MVEAKVVEAKAKWLDGERFVVAGSSGHAVVIDSDRQSNTAPGPMELVLSALCSCTATDVVSILRKKREPFTALEVRAEAERAPSPPTVYTSIKLIFTVTGQVSRKAVEDAVRLSEEKYCSVAAMLRSTARITTEIRLHEAVARAEK